MAKRQIRSAAVPTVADPPALDQGAAYFGPCEVVEFTRRTRAAEPAAAAGEERVVYDVVISSENPVLGSYYEQVLGHGEGEIDLRSAKGGLSLLIEHGGPSAPYRVDPDYHAGLVTEIRQDGKKLRGVVEFGSEPRAVRAEADFAKGVRPFISVGWLPGPNLQSVVTKRSGKPDLVRITGWRPAEVSIVSVPADFTARKGRSGPGIEGFPVITEGLAPVKEEPKMKRVRNAATGVIEVVSDDDARPVAVEATPEGGQRSAGEIQIDGNKRASQIVRICKQFGIEARSVEFIESNLSVPEVCDKILETRAAGTIQTQPAAEHLAPTIPGVDKKTARRFSVLRALRCAVSGKYEGFEGEIHTELEKSLPSNFERHGERSILVPMRLAELTDEDLFVRQTRALGSGIPDSGATLVTSTQGELIDLLRNATKCVKLGARTVPGLVGTIQFPKKTSGSSVRRMGENPPAGAAESSSKYGWVIGSPKTYIGNTICPRQLINLTSFDVEADMRQDLVADHGVAFDFDGIYGQGAANEPLGVYPDTNTQTQAMGGVPSWQKLIKMAGKVLTKNISDEDIGFMTTSLMAAELAVTTRGSTTVPPFIWEGPLQDGRIGPYKASSTNQMSATHSGRAKVGGTEHGLICGPWQNLLFLLWGVLELQVDTITLADKGQIKVLSFMMGDVVNQRPDGFVVSTGATVTA